ncbi:MAG: 16S rRNA (cytidine(1402)-2'-O)-methyltransferase [Spirochaetes bacterium RBG_13_51_14]|nr:MAG: 16S rRNA (cytidine(1402)-2'-O)-methyltransferase [Spirochaetes bacterium RBG_13_51_14]
METGTLYIIATPIGNLGDITVRAIDTLKHTAGVIYCEDTRQTRKLLDHYGIATATQSLHTHSSPRTIEGAINHLLAGTSVAYVTDSGTPGLSDPGSKLVSAARARGIPVCPVPGPSALTAIVSISGYRGKNIAFAGFLSKKENKRKAELSALKEFDGMIVLYESPYRIKKLLHAIKEVFPGRDLLIGREMTKFHEEFIFGSIEKLISDIRDIKEKGEFTVTIFNNKHDIKI